MASPTAIVAYLALFAGVAILFLFVNLVVGRLVRPKLPNEEKLAVYECGEPTIGTSFVQFDLRFYVVALLFIIFDVEIAFFFPWATVFGKSTQLASSNEWVMATDHDPEAAPGQLSQFPQPVVPSLAPDDARALANRLGPEPDLSTASRGAVQVNARKLALASLADIAVFFAVLLVGFAYVWKRGDLDWVRAVRSQQGEVVQRAVPDPMERTGGARGGAGSILSPPTTSA